MGLPRSAVKLLAPILKGREVLCLGYPDLIMSPEVAKTQFGVDVGGWDGGVGYGLPPRIAETKELFAALGAVRTYVVDVRSYDRVDRAGFDLNMPHPEVDKSFDLVIDPGTMEHCANVGQALMTAAGAVRGAGYVLHISPVTMINHGFYNMNPVLLRDFYTQNGWDIRSFGAFLAHPPFEDVVWEEKWNKGRMPLENNLALLALVQRRADAPDLKWPAQEVYRK